MSNIIIKILAKIGQIKNSDYNFNSKSFSNFINKKMDGINHKIKLGGNSAYNHFKKHHKKYVFGLLSTAAAYKLISLAITGFFANPGIHFSFADDVIDPTPETEIVEEMNNNEEEQNIEESEGNLEEIENNENNENNEGENLLINSCVLGDIEITNPLSGDTLKGEIEIELDYKKDDCLKENLTIKLRDANTQYVKIGEITDGKKTFLFDSSLLYSGFYNITGVNSTGEEIVLHTGDYAGLNTKYFTGHKLVIYSSEMSIIYEGNEFTIDNEKPTISNTRLVISGTNDGFVGLEDKIGLKFDSSEELTGVIVNILGVDAELRASTGNQYEYFLNLSAENTEGNIIYNIEFEDLAGNTGYYEGSSNIVFDKSIPELINMDFILSGENIELEIDTKKLSKITFVYSLSGNDKNRSYISPYLQSHLYSFSGILEKEYYNYTLSITNQANKSIYFGGHFQLVDDEITFTKNEILEEEMLVVAAFTGKVNTGSFAEMLLLEIEKFKTCKASIGDFTSMNIPVGLHTAKIQMPDLEKFSVKKLVSAFSVVLFERMETAKLSKDSVDKIANDFNDFLVILKLVQDDDNQCEQNLSNYYMSKFKSNLEKYNLTID